jgi:chemotaxis protein CheC
MRLSTVQADAIQELGNIGAAHAATTLSQMLECPIEMSVPDIRTIELSRLADYMGEEPAVMVAFELQGEISHGGYILFYIARESAIHLTNTMLGLKDSNRLLDEMDKSALLEVSNIMVSAFLGATAELLGFVMLPSPPALTIDMAHAAMQTLIAQMEEEANEVLLFSTELIAEEHKIDSDIIMMPEISTLTRIVGLLENMVRR